MRHHALYGLIHIEGGTIISPQLIDGATSNCAWLLMSQKSHQTQIISGYFE
jgi:hypothetical protein